MTSITHPALTVALASCTPVVIPGGSICQMSMDVPVAAGEVIATVKPGKGLDVGFRDYRLSTGASAFANPSHHCPGTPGSNPFARCYAVCALEQLPAMASRNG
jgi:hypothetical protein